MLRIAQRMWRRTAWLLLAASVSTACVGDRPFTSPRTYYVATNGSDLHNGRSLSSAFRSINRAISAANPGDTIEVRGGVYPGGITIFTPGVAQAWIRMRPYRDEKVVIDGTGRTHAVYFYNPQFVPMYWTLEGFEIRGGEEYVVKIDTPYVQLLNNNLYGSKADIVKLVQTAHHVVISGNEIHHNRAPNGANAQGVDIVGASDVVIARNYVHDIPSIGMYAKGSASNIVFEYNRVENIFQRGIMLGQSTDLEFLDRRRPYETYDSIIRYNTVRNTGSACLATASSSNVQIHHNLCENAATQAHGAIFVSNESELHQAGSRIDISDNVVLGAGTRPVVYIGPDALTAADSLRMERNRYWTKNGAAAVRFSWERGARRNDASNASIWNVSFGEWQRRTGLETRSRVIAVADQADCVGARCAASIRTPQLARP